MTPDPEVMVPPLCVIASLDEAIAVLSFNSETEFVPALIFPATLSTPVLAALPLLAVSDTSPLALMPELFTVKPLAAVAVNDPVLIAPKVKPVVLESVICTAPPALELTA